MRISKMELLKPFIYNYCSDILWFFNELFLMLRTFKFVLPKK